MALDADIFYLDRTGRRHACYGHKMVETDPGTYLVWTLCGMDVPPNEGYQPVGRNGSPVRADEVTCDVCKKLLLEDEDTEVF